MTSSALALVSLVPAWPVTAAVPPVTVSPVGPALPVASGPPALVTTAADLPARLAELARPRTGAALGPGSDGQPVSDRVSLSGCCTLEAGSPRVGLFARQPRRPAFAGRRRSRALSMAAS